MGSTDLKGATHHLPAASRLSKQELSALMTSAKVNVYLGGAPNAELLFAVPRALISKFSPTWNDQLTAAPARALYLPRSFSKEPIKFVIEWMAAGNSYSTAKGAVKYPKDNLVNLVCLNQLATHLGVDGLKQETLKSIDLYTQRQRMDLTTIDRLFKKPDVSSEALAIIKTNTKKLIRGPKKQTWSEEAEEYPGRFPAGLSFLAALGKEVAEENEARRKARLSGGKRQHAPKQPTATRSATEGKILADTPAANGKGPRNGGPSTFKGPNRVTRGRKNDTGSQVASSAPANATGETAAQKPKAAKMNVVCFNCGQPDHTRPYCSNPRVFLGNCYLCDQQGHRAAECPTKTIAKKDENTNEPSAKRNNAGHKNRKAGASKNVRQSIEPVLPPLVAHIVFVKDAKNTSGKGTAARSTSNPTSPGGSVSSTSTKPNDTPRTSPETTPPPTTPTDQKSKAANQANKPAKQEDKPAEKEDTPKVYRFAPGKIRALNITADGGVQREIVPGDQAKGESS